MTYVAAADRYDSMTYRRVGRSGIKLPLVSLGLWHNFGSGRSLDTQRAILRRAVDLGVCHIDLANNYGPPYVTKCAMVEAPPPARGARHENHHPHQAGRPLCAALGGHG